MQTPIASFRALIESLRELMSKTGGAELENVKAQNGEIVNTDARHPNYQATFIIRMCGCGE